MITTQTWANQDGDTWLVEYVESPRLTHIGGFLMTYRDISRITISAHLSPADQAHGREVLLSRLAAVPIGRSRTILWHPGDE